MSDQEYDDDELEEVSPGQFAKRNADGQFTGGSLTSEEARRRVSARWDRENATNLEKAKRILGDRGIEWDSADESLKALAEIGAEGKSGSVPALRYLDRLTNYGPSQGEGMGLKVIREGSVIEYNGVIYHRDFGNLSAAGWEFIATIFEMAEKQPDDGRPPTEGAAKFVEAMHAKNQAKP